MTKINAANLIERFSSTRVGKFFGNPAANAAVAIATVSNVTKDGVNCAYYVTQSLHNERIPEDQRKFVAGLDLANGILKLLNKPYGIYHVCGSGSTSWYGFASEILKGVDANLEILKPCTTKEFERPAKRPAYSVMNNNGLCRDWRVSLKDYLMLR